MPKCRSTPRGDSYHQYLQDRQFGFRTMGLVDRLHGQLARDMVRPPTLESRSNLPPYFEHSENPFYSIQRYSRLGKFYTDQVPVSSPGGIFNIEFNSDGKILAAACEKKCILIFDPLTRKLTRTIENAHSDCVNCIRFLDSRTFATCSDDTTVALWDARNLKSKVRTLRGHSNWVKNIEYHSGQNLLVTSGFDGAIYTWDINQYSEKEAQFKKVFYTNGLMRMRLTPDCTKMVVSTMNGYLVVVHDLDLHTMAEDLAGFKPNMYRLMQISGKALELAINYTKLFHTKRNRVEIISDFPQGNDAEVLSSLRLHPQGWVALSRNTSSDESTEWCCVHDIQARPTNEEDDELIADRKPLTWRSGPAGGTVGSTMEGGSEDRRPGREAGAEGGEAESITLPWVGEPRVQTFRAGSIEIISTGLNTGADVGRPVIEIDLGTRRRMRQERGRRGRREGGEEGEVTDDRVVTVDREVPVGEEVEVGGARFVSADSLATLNAIAGGGEGGEGRVPPPGVNIVGAGLAPVGALGEGAGQRGGFLIIGPQMTPRGRGRVLYFGTPGEHRAQQQRIPKDARIHKNVPRLTHFIEESNTGKGFIKEQCFSPCGRVIASPFGYGVRLLGFNEAVQDLSSCVPTDSVRLHEIGTKLGHEEVVLSTAFSPAHWLLATGCLLGRVVWHQPVL